MWIALTLGLLPACAAPAAENVCVAAAERVAECTSLEIAPPTSCTPDEAAEAERVLGSSCPALTDIGKADFSFKCSWVGRQLGACNFIPEDDDVLVSIGDAQKPAFEERAIEVLVWNVYKGNKEEWDRDMIALSRNVDLALVQEFFLDEDSTRTFDETGDLAWTFATSFRQGAEDGPRTGVTTGSNVTPTSAAFRRSEAREPIAGTPKIGLITTYDLAFRDEDLLVVNVHAINFRTTGDFEAQISDLEAAIAQHVGPVLVAGDFNTWWPSRHSFLEESMARQHLVYVPLAEDERGLLQLDHVFVREMSVSRPRLLNEIESSDHTPIRVRLMVDNGA